MKKLHPLLILIAITAFSKLQAQTPGVQWKRRIQSLPSYNIGGQIIYGISKINSGGYVFVGADTLYRNDKPNSLKKEFGAYPLIIKSDNDGNVKWSQKLTQYFDNSFFSSVIQTNKGELLTVGFGAKYLSGTYTYKYLVTNYKNDGTLKWNKELGGTNKQYAQSIVQARDGNYVVAGYTNSSDGDVSGNHGSGTYDFWVIKLDTSGNLLWQKCFGGSSDEKAYSIKETSDGGFIVAGSAASNNGSLSSNKGASDGWIIKLDGTGNMQWQKNFGGISNDEFRAVLQTNDGGYIVTGYTYSNDADVSGNHGDADFWVIRLDGTGNKIWQKCYGGSNEEYSSSIETTPDNAYLISGHTFSNDGDVSALNGGSDAWIIKINDVGNLIWQKTVGTYKNEFGTSAKALTENEFVVAGYTDSTLLIMIPPMYFYLSLGILVQ